MYHFIKTLVGIKVYTYIWVYNIEVHYICHLAKH